MNRAPESLRIPPPAVVGHPKKLRIEIANQPKLDLGRLAIISWAFALLVVASLEGLSRAGVNLGTLEYLRPAAQLVYLVTPIPAFLARTRTTNARRDPVCLAIATFTAIGLLLVPISKGHLGAPESGILATTISALLLGLFHPANTFRAVLLVGRVFVGISVGSLLLTDRLGAGVAYSEVPLRPGYPFGEERFTSLLPHPNLAGYVFAVQLVMELCVLRTPGGKTVRLCSAAASLLLTILTGSVSAALAVFASCLVLVTSRRSIRAGVIASGLTISLLPGAITFAYVAGLTSWLTPDATATSRGLVWRLATAEIRDHALLGVPANSVLPVDAEHLEPGSLPYYGLSHAHNMLLEGWLLFGLVGVLVFVVAFSLLLVIARFGQRSSALFMLLLVFSATEVPLLALPASLNALATAGTVAGILAFSQRGNGCI